MRYVQRIHHPYEPKYDTISIMRVCVYSVSPRQSTLTGSELKQLTKRRSAGMLAPKP